MKSGTVLNEERRKERRKEKKGQVVRTRVFEEGKGVYEELGDIHTT